MDKKKKYLLITLGVIGALLLVVGITYAYWILTRQQEGTNVVNSACLNIDIESESDDISLLKTYPILDSEGEKLKPYKFSVHNECSDMATYQINLESLSTVLAENRLNLNYLKVKLNEVGQDGIEKVLGETSPTDTTIENTYEAHKLMSGYLEANETKNFELRLWMHEKVTVENADSMNKQFKSKITVTSTYINEDDIPPTSELALSVCENTITATATATPYKDKSISKYEYQIDKEEWQEGSETQRFTKQSTGDHTIKLRVTDNKGATSEVEQTIDTTPEIVEIAGKQITLVTCGDGLYKVEHNDLEELSNEWNKTEYRFAGSDSISYVHNYVKFNNELWRIIGLVNVKVGDHVEQRLKIVRQNGVENQKDFGKYAWDKNNSNNWTNSSLKAMLNGIYFESGIGECYTGDNDSFQEKTCDFKSGTDLPKGLDDIARNMIDRGVSWNIGGSSTYNDVTVKMFYERERGTSTYNNYPTEWNWWIETDKGGKYYGIGLIYLSDYGYAVGGYSRNDCFKKRLYDYNEVGCSTDNWMSPIFIPNVSNGIWTLSPYSSDFVLFFINERAAASLAPANITFHVWPTVYLNSSVRINGGEGTLERPYLLKLNS